MKGGGIILGVDWWTCGLGGLFCWGMGEGKGTRSDRAGAFYLCVCGSVPGWVSRKLVCSEHQLVGRGQAEVGLVFSAPCQFRLV